MNLQQIICRVIFTVWQSSDIVEHPLWAKQLIFKLTGIRFALDRGKAKDTFTHFKETHKEVFQAYGIPGNWFSVTYWEEEVPPPIVLKDVRTQITKITKYACAYGMSAAKLKENIHRLVPQQKFTRKNAKKALAAVDKRFRTLYEALPPATRQDKSQPSGQRTGLR